MARARSASSQPAGQGAPEAGRYLVLTELFLPTKGGTAVWFDAVYRHLGGRHTHIVTAAVEGAAAHDRDHPNTVHRVPLRRYRWLRPESLAMYLRMLGRALRVGLSARPDAVHAGRVLPEGLVGWMVARMLGKPLLIYAHGEEITAWHNPGKRRVMTWTYRRADRIIANSEFTHHALIGLGIERQRITLLHPGVDLERFRPGLQTADLRQRLRLTADARLILCVGRLSRRKGFDRVIGALPGLVAAGLDAHCAIIGTGEDRDYLAACASDAGCAGRVHFLGHVPAEELPRWYCAANLFAMPNREINGDNEGFGMVFIEAAACGVPALAGVDGGTGSAVIDGVTGVRVDGKDPDAVTEALRRLLADPEATRHLGERALERARAQFDWQRVAARTAALLSGTGT